MHKKYIKNEEISLYTQTQNLLLFAFSMLHGETTLSLSLNLFTRTRISLSPPSILSCLLSLPTALLPPQSSPNTRYIALLLNMANARSGMGVNDNCKLTFLELQRKKLHRYVVFKIDEKKKEVVVEKTGEAAESYSDFTAALPSNDCRYAVFDFDFVTEDNCQKSKIFFIAWSPESCKIRTKFLYATSKDRFRKELDGVHYELQATDPTELDIQVIRDRAN